jgi:glycosyltransferase involved in cell wall biosynthesis
VKSFFRRLFKPAGSVTAVGMAADSPMVGRRVLIFTEHFNATYYISFDIPLRALHARGETSFRAYDQQAVANGGECCWRQWLDSFRPDVVFFTRYGRADGASIMHDCRMRGIPIVYHIDDNLLDLPPSLGLEIVARQGAAAAARRTMLERCDLIYASTRVLADVLKGYFPQKPIFQGIYASMVQVKLPPANPDAPLTIGYMGSKGHKEDLALVVPALVSLMEQRPKLRVETFGTIEMPRELLRFGERVQHHTVQKGYHGFLQTLADLNWTIGLAPLVDEPFNRCKAPTKFIEYTSCGIPVVASDAVPYAEAIVLGCGVLVQDNWEVSIARLLDDSDERSFLVTTAQAHCVNTYATHILEAQLLSVIDRMKQ